MTVLQSLLSPADIAAKVEFSALIHKVAGSRTADDISALGQPKAG